jgi:hypothetical protein
VSRAPPKTPTRDRAQNRRRYQVPEIALVVVRADAVKGTATPRRKALAGDTAVTIKWAGQRPIREPCASVSLRTQLSMHLLTPNNRRVQADAMARLHYTLNEQQGIDAYSKSHAALRFPRALSGAAFARPRRWCTRPVQEW